MLRGDGHRAPDAGRDSRAYHLAPAVLPYLVGTLTTRARDVTSSNRRCDRAGSSAARRRRRPRSAPPSSPLGDNTPTKKVMGVLSIAVEKVAREAFTTGQETEPR
ncbi:hypothetical protein P3T39_002407 [Kitasatospora sp. GP82]|nr:hypothetical protein [Kitasatospora sp. GP82]